MKRLDQLTFSRFAAVFLVLTYHGSSEFYLSVFNENPVVMALFKSAPTAVGYLYALSGFVMSLVYFRPEQRFDVFGYWRARVVRIYPLYLLAFLLTCYYYLDSMLAIKPQKILANLLVLQAWIPAYAQSFNYASWSMTVEFFFYAVFPFFTMWAYRQSTRKLIALALAFWAVSQTVYQILWIGYLDEYRNFIIYSPIFHLNSFLMGAVGAIWYLREGRRQVVPPWMTLAVVWGSLGLAAGYTIVSSVYYPHRLPHDLQPMAGLLAPILTLFIASLAMDRSRLSRALERPAPVVFGETSYAIYILHVPILWLFKRFLEDSRIAGAETIFEIAALPMMIAIGLGVHFYVDAPLRRWLREMLQRVNIPMLLLELAVVWGAVFLVYRLRFGEGREYNSYREMLRLTLWCAIFLRLSLSLAFKTYTPALLSRSPFHIVRAVFLSTALGSLLLAALVYAGIAAGWFENFPRSVFLMEGAIVFAVSLLIRFVFRTLKIYQPPPVAA